MENSFKDFNNAAKNIALTTATVLALQAAPNVLCAQSNGQNQSTRMTSKSQEFIKFSTKALIVGIDNGIPVYKNDKGEFFTLNSTTGDMRFIKPEEFATYSYTIKMSNNAARTSALTHIKFSATDVASVTVLGMDKEGHCIQRNSRGEAYYVHPNTGDLVYVKN
jgi:hypothetical protein